MFTPAIIILALFGTTGLCNLYEDVADLPSRVYDYVVVGGMYLAPDKVLGIDHISGGTAGNVVANRLTEDPSVSVLVLEAGVS